MAGFQHFRCRSRFVGLVGGMGSLAGVDFAAKLVYASAGRVQPTCDQEHIPFLLWSAPHIPDRIGSIINPDFEDPFPALAEAVEDLARAGALVVAIACNTAHHWHSRLSVRVDVPILHIADAAIETLQQYSRIRKVGILASAATLKVGIYQSRLAKHGITSVVLGETEADELILPAIMEVKRGQIRRSPALIEEAVARLIDRGVEAVVLGCTELPVILNQLNLSAPIVMIDATRSLAEACVNIWVSDASSSQAIRSVQPWTMT